jgi:hypothetical protein
MALPFIQEVQFPFRWLTIVVVSGSIITAAGIKPIWKIAQSSLREQKIIKTLTIVSAFGLILVFSLTWISVSNSYLPANTFDKWVNDKANSKGFDFFWTTQTKEEAFDIKEKVIANDRKITISDWRPYDRIFTVEKGNAEMARVATLFYPHWQAKVNNEAVKIELATDGAMLIPLPPQAATVEVKFIEPIYIQFAAIISITAWILMLMSVLIIIVRNNFPHLKLKPQPI